MITTRFTLLLLAAAAAASTGCTKAHGQAAPPPRPVATAAVASAGAAPGVRYTATLEAIERVEVAFKASGYVDALLERRGADGRMRPAQAGDTIARGARLAHVRDADARARVDQATARIAEADAAVTKARADLGRARVLFDAESGTKTELDAAQAALEAGEARAAAARAELALTRNALNDCSLMAPSSGVVLERRVETGTLASPGVVAFVIADVSAVKARFGVPDGAVAAVRLGDSLAIVFDGLDGVTATGRVTAVAPAADPRSRVFTVEVTIPNRDGQLRPGLIGAVTLSAAGGAAVAADRSQVSVPLTAIVRSPDEPDGYAVVVVERQNGREVARLRRVALGALIGNGVEVASGVRPGERVVVSGAQLLADGEAVQAMP
jgi:RND family efflux transporter MFP subunit